MNLGLAHVSDNYQNDKHDYGNHAQQSGYRVNKSDEPFISVSKVHAEVYKAKY